MIQLSAEVLAPRYIDHTIRMVRADHRRQTRPARNYMLRYLMTDLDDRTAAMAGRRQHQELLMHFRQDDVPSNAAGVLFQLASELIEGRRGLLRGDVVGPRGEVSRTIVLTWLVPITDDEATFVRTQGWSAFETALVTSDPDLTDLRRSSAI